MSIDKSLDIPGVLRQIAVRTGSEETKEVSWHAVRRLGLAIRTPAGPGSTRFLGGEIAARLYRRSNLIGRLGPPVAQRLLPTILRLAEKTLGQTLSSSGDSVLLIGRQRWTLLDFGQRCVTTVDSHPQSASLNNEIRARNHANAALMPMVLSADVSKGVLCTEMLDGDNLAARPSRVDIDDLLARWRREPWSVPSDEYLSGIVDELQPGAIPPGYDGHGLLTSVRRLDAVEMAWSHGDLQPANIVVDQGGPKLVDLENFGERWSGYDGWVYKSGVRWSARIPGDSSPLALVEEWRYRSGKSRR